ncbi:MAG: hypothetical protein Kow00107_08720 [Planctomycetota bacterium]
MVLSGIRFAQRQVPKILAGEKTFTRIKLPSPWEPGSTITAFQMVDDVERPFAVLKVVSVKEQLLGSISEEEARKEGYEGRADFFAAWESIHGYLNESETVWAIEFTLVRPIAEEEIISLI